MADIIELGRKTKAKYPGAYDDIDDAELGRKIKAKFPNDYADFADVDLKASNLPGTTPNMIGAFGQGAIVDTAKGALMALMTPKAKVLRGIVDSHIRQGKRVGEDIRRGRYIDAAADAVMTVIPGIGPLAGDAAENINTGIRSNNPTAAARASGNLLGAIVAPEAVRAGVPIVTKGAPVIAATVKGGMAGGTRALMDSAHQPITTVDLLIPGAKKAKLTANAVSGFIEGARKGASEQISGMTAEMHRAQNPGRMVARPDIQPPAEATPIVNPLPSGRRPLTAVELDFLNSKKRVRPPAATVPVERSAIPESLPISGSLPSGRRPLTQAELVQKYAPKSSPLADAIISDYMETYGGSASKPKFVPPPTPAAAIERLSPKMQEMARQLADDIGPTGSTVERPVVQYEAGARAKKVWNMSDLLAEHGLTAEDAALMDDAMWAQATKAINQANAVEAAGTKFNRHHIPSKQSRMQIIQEMRDAEARRSQTP